MLRDNLILLHHRKVVQRINLNRLARESTIPDHRILAPLIAQLIRDQHLFVILCLPLLTERNNKPLLRVRLLAQRDLVPRLLKLIQLLELLVPLQLRISRHIRQAKGFVLAQSLLTGVVLGPG